MTKRLIPFALPLLALLAGCPSEVPTGGDRAPYIDEWETVVEVDANTLTTPVEYISIGDRLTGDNFANRGNVEVIFAPGSTIRVEVQRFTIQSSQESADEAFGRMQYWGYNASTPGPRDPAANPDDAALLCFTGDNSSCYIRAYYDGMVQPVRDGMNFRVTLPAGWDGQLDITTSDNVADGLERYPDRGDVSVMGLAGSLAVDLDSGNVAVKFDPNVAHYAGCASSATCEEMDFVEGCGCLDPTNVRIANAAGQSSNITIDVPTTSPVTGEGRWYDVQLENKGMFSGMSEFVCQASIECDWGACEIDPDYAALEYKEWAAINYPGEPAVPGTGIRIVATSENCANIAYLEDPESYELDEFPTENRGELRFCTGCL